MYFSCNAWIYSFIINIIYSCIEHSTTAWNAFETMKIIKIIRLILYIDRFTSHYWFVRSMFGSTKIVFKYSMFPICDAYVYSKYVNNNNCYNERLKKPWSKRRLNNFNSFFLTSNILWILGDGMIGFMNWNRIMIFLLITMILYSFSNFSGSEVKTWFNYYFKMIDAATAFSFYFHSISFDRSRATKYTNTLEYGMV